MDSWESNRRIRAVSDFFYCQQSAVKGTEGLFCLTFRGEEKVGVTSTLFLVARNRTGGG